MIKPAQKYSPLLDKLLWYGTLALLAYMPFHVFLSTSLSLVTGGLDAWKAAKDVVLYLLAAVALYILVKRGKLRQKPYSWIALTSVAYVLLHVFLALIYGRHTVNTSILGIIFNGRIPASLCIGMAVAVSHNQKHVLKRIVQVMLVASTVVALFGVAQYVLPKNMLAHVGYTPARGVKPMFYIDDKPDLPRVMSTMRDPNTLGAFLLLPMLLVLYLVRIVRPQGRMLLYGAFVAMLGCLLLTYSRSALLGLLLSLGVYAALVHQKTALGVLKKYWLVVLVLCLLPIGGYMLTKNTYFVKNTVLHEDQSTKQEGSNGLHLDFAKNAVRKIVKQPWGYGPGTAGLVSIRGTQGLLTENYYLQIGIEVGVLGLILFLWLNFLVARRLLTLSRNSGYAAVTLAAFIGLAFINTLLHMWSGEAVVLYWWLFAGVLLVSGGYRKVHAHEKIKVFVDGVPLASERPSGIGHLLRSTLAELAKNDAFKARYDLILFVPKNKRKALKKNIISGAAIKTLPYPATRIVNGLNYIHLLPNIDLTLGKGIYLFGNYSNYPVSKKSKSVTWVHDLCFERYPETVSPKLQHHLHKHVPEWVRRTDKVVGISNFSRSEIIDFYKVNKNKVAHVPAGVDTSIFYRRTEQEVKRAKQKYDLPAEYILFVGNIEPRKNLQRLVIAYDQIPKELKDKYPLVIIGGDSWNNEDIYAEINRARANGAKIIIPVKYVPDEDMPAVISGATLLAHVAVYEGFGITPLEALACGTPVLVSDIPPLHEVVGNFGEFVDPGSADAIATSLTKLLKKQSAVAGASGQVNSLSWEKSAQSLLSLLDELSVTIKEQK